VPVQSGSNEVLKNMNRYYTFKDFRKLVSKFRSEVLDLSVSTDIICGFPGETKKQFDETLQLVEWLKPDVLNISKFGLRPGTEAEKMKQVTGKEIKSRSSELSALWKKISSEKNEKWVNWEGEVLLDEYGYGSTMVGRNQSYKAVVIKTSSELGSTIRVRVDEALQGYLKGVEIKKLQ
jgi:tRNA A37 methylthiotransferase MiaB